MILSVDVADTFAASVTGGGLAATAGWDAGVAGDFAGTATATLFVARRVLAAMRSTGGGSHMQPARRGSSPKTINLVNSVIPRTPVSMAFGQNETHTPYLDQPENPLRLSNIAALVHIRLSVGKPGSARAAQLVLIVEPNIARRGNIMK